LSRKKLTEKKVLEDRVRYAVEICDRYEDEIRAIIHYNIKDKSKADDIFQEFFVSIVRKPIPPDIQDIQAYLYRAVVNDVIDASRPQKNHQDHIKKHAERSKHFLIGEDRQNIAIEIEDTKRMFQLLESHLSKREAEIILQRYVHGFSTRDIAKQMHVDKRTASRYLSSALKKMREFIQADDTYDNVKLEEETQEKTRVLDDDVFPKLKEWIFKKISEDIIKLEHAGKDESQILFCLMELEVSLCMLEEEARITNRTYEEKLAASLRDICKVHEPGRISKEQIKCFTDSVRHLMEGWGEFDRKKLSTIRSKLLSIGLNWLPITDKAASDLSDGKNS
jgi:RNA polymerase sigma factor (sigma-70 family)